MRDLPHDYANLVYNLMAMQYWQSRYQMNMREPTKALFPEAAHEYAQRNRATGAAATEVITAQMKDAIAQGDWALALRDLAQLRENAPDDPVLRGYLAQALVGAGNALQAREEFTRVLCNSPLWVEGYLARAQAHFMLGDNARARADLVVAASMGAGKFDELQRELSKFKLPDATADSMQRFETAVQSDGDFAALVADALEVHRLANMQRQRYDESYQLRIRVLSEAMRDYAHNADYPEALGRFLYNFYQMPVLWNGPRGAGKQVRPQSAVDRDNELKRALDLSDAALQLDPQSANAMATKAWLLRTIKAAGAEALADEGLKIDPDNVRLLNLKGISLQDRASELEAKASTLRAGHTDSHTENRSDGVYEVTTHYAPTAAQLAEAAQLEEQAKQLRDQAAALLSHSRQVTDELIPSLLKQSRASVAYLHDPDRADVLLQLADQSAKKGDSQAAEIYSLLAQRFPETTASTELKLTWDACQHTAWKAAEGAARQAMQIDPADARGAAYLSIIQANGDTPDPIAARRSRIAALALEEARARLMGTTLLPGNAPSLDLPDLQQAGLSMALRLKAGNAYLAANQPDQAVAPFAENVSLEKRFDAHARVEFVPTAMLPDPAGDANSVPTAPTFASLLGSSRLGLAEAYLQLHKPDEAQAQYTAIRAYLANWPATAPGRESLNIVDSWARLGQAEAAHQGGDDPRALNIVEGMDGWPPGLPAELETRRKQLADLLHAQMNGRELENVNRQMNLSPDEARAQSLKQEIAAFQKQRDAMSADLNDPNVSARQRQVEQSSVDQLDQLIAQRKAALQNLTGQTPTH
jgi:hypothetical protein